jgi:hypothetical protein
VFDADGSPLSVRNALALINQTLDEVLAEQEGDFDADTRWAVAWFEQFGFAEGDYGVAETLSKAKNSSVGGLVDAGIVDSGRGKARLLRPDELPTGWDPVHDTRLTVWEAVHHLVRALDEGEHAAADLVRRLGGAADAARELAYRLYALCERKKRTQEALSYNALVQSWPEIQRLASEASSFVQETMGLMLTALSAENFKSWELIDHSPPEPGVTLAANGVGALDQLLSAASTLDGPRVGPRSVPSCGRTAPDSPRRPPQIIWRSL